MNAPRRAPRRRCWCRSSATRRTPGWCSPSAARDLRRHAGEISFPGGRRDSPDEDLSTTALREAEEEIGLDPGEVELVGALPPIGTFVTGYKVHPFVGLIAEDLALRAQPGRGRGGARCSGSRSCATASRCAAWSAAASRSAPRPTWSAST